MKTLIKLAIAIAAANAIFHVASAYLSHAAAIFFRRTERPYRWKVSWIVRHDDGAVRVEDFACQMELDGREEIDLTEPIREDILLALPAHPRCDMVGGKVCPGVKRPEEAPPAGEEAPPVWAALDQLKIR